MASSQLGFAGILPPVTTPFDARDEVDLPALARNAARYDESGVAGFVAFGSSGEAVHLDASEQDRILDTLRRTVRPDRTLVAGVNALSLRSASASIARAADRGADAALVITPYFYQGAMTQAALRSYFLALADASPLPILLYNIPQNTGVTLAPATVADLAGHERIVGIKDSSGDFGGLTRIIRRTPSEFAVLTGHAPTLFPALTMGATGGILGVGCVAPEVCVALYRAAHAGDTAGARELQHRLAPLARMVTATLGVPGLKAALDLAGYDGGAPRAPLRPIDEAARDRLTEVMEATGFFPDLA